MKLRLNTNVPLFDHAGFKLTPAWQEIDLDKLGQDGRFAIETYHDRKPPLVFVHPHDETLYAQLVAANAKARDQAAKAASVAAKLPKKE